jgi:hypothetical protein
MREKDPTTGRIDDKTRSNFVAGCQSQRGRQRVVLCRHHGVDSHRNACRQRSLQSLVVKHHIGARQTVFASPHHSYEWPRATHDGIKRCSELACFDVVSPCAIGGVPLGIWRYDD